MSNTKGYRNGYSAQLSKIHPGSSGDFILPIHRTETQKPLARGSIWWPSSVQDTSFQERLLCPKRCPSSPISPPCPLHPAHMFYPLSFTAESLVSTHKHCLLHVLHSPSLSSSFGTLDIDLDTLIILTYLFSPLVCQLLKESPVLNHLVYYCKPCSILGGR